MFVCVCTCLRTCVPVSASACVCERGGGVWLSMQVCVLDLDKTVCNRVRTRVRDCDAPS